MAIVECRYCGFSIDAMEIIPLVCPACGAKSTRAVARTDEPSPPEVEDILRILEKIPDAPAEPDDETEMRGPAPTVHCRVCGVFEDNDARTPVCSRCGLPATAQDFRMEGFRSTVSVIPEDTPEDYAAKVLAKATALGVIPIERSEEFMRIALEPSSEAFRKIAARIRQEIDRRRRAIDFAFANTRISGGKVTAGTRRTMEAWARGEITDDELIEIVKRG